MRRIVVALAFAALTASCHHGVGEKGIPGPSVPLPTNFIVRLERTACYGWCPVYVVTVFDDGRVEYDGQECVKTIGHREARLTPGNLAQIDRFMDAMRFWDLNDRYTEYGVTDCPTVIVSRSKAGKTKIVLHYHGDRIAPSRLTEIEDGLDALLATDEWIGTKTERDELAKKRYGG